MFCDCAVPTENLKEPAKSKDSAHRPRQNLNKSLGELDLREMRAAEYYC